MAEKKSWRDYAAGGTKAKEDEGDEKTNSWRDYVDPTAIVGKSLTEQLNNLLTNHNTLISDYQKRNEGRKYSYEDAYVSDSADWLNSTTEQWNTLDNEADSVLEYLDQYGGHLAPKVVDDIRSTINSVKGTKSKIIDAATKDNEYWSGFGSEEMVKTYGSAEEAYKYYQRDDSYSKKYAGATYDDIRKTFQNGVEGDEREWLLRNQGDIVGNTIRSSDDYMEYAGVGAELSYEDFGTATRHRGKSRRMRSVTTIDKYRAASMAMYEHYGNGEVYGYTAAGDDQIDIYRTMTDDEFNTLAYCIAKDKEQGTNLAEQYIDSIEETLNIRRGTDIGNSIKDIPVVADLYGVVAGIDQFGTGLENLFSDKDYYVTSPVQAASGVIRESMGDDGFKLPDWMGGASLRQGLYDLTTTTANMAPSILASYAANALVPGSGIVVGNALMGASATGNAYAEAVNRGFGKDEAKLYANAVGASEVLLGALLGGISDLGGISPMLSKAVSGIENGLVRFALQYGGKIVSEGVEEGLQEILDPVFQNMILHADEDIDWSQVAYSALLGGLSAGVLEGVTTYKEVRAETALNKDAVKQYGGKTDALIQEGLKNDVKSDSYKLAQKYQQQVQGKDGEGGKAMTGNQIRNLLAANQEQITPKDMKLIQTAAEKRLTDLGQTEDVEKLAELATKFATGGKLSKADKNFLASSKYGSRVANELLPKNIASEGFSTEWAEEIGTKQVNAAAYNKKTIDQVRAIVEQMANIEDPNAYKSLEARVGTEGRFGVAESGQAVIRETNEAIDINTLDVATVGDGQMTFKVADGKEVSAGEIDFADENQSYLVSAVSDIENITPAAATAIMHDVVDTSKPLGAQLNGIDEAYTYGFNGYSVEDLKVGDYAPGLTNKQMMSAYKLGQSARNISDVDADAPIVKMRTAADATVSKQERVAQQKSRFESDDVEVYFLSKKDGSITKFDGNTDRYDDKRTATIRATQILSKMQIGGSGYYLYESYINAAGERVYKDENGV
jgi:hypothetical protein